LVGNLLNNSFKGEDFVLVKRKVALECGCCQVAKHDSSYDHSKRENSTHNRVRIIVSISDCKNCNYRKPTRIVEGSEVQSSVVIFEKSYDVSTNKNECCES
jgi:hypothetical protein